MMKRLISLLLVLAVLSGYLPVAARAEDTEDGGIPALTEESAAGEETIPAEAPSAASEAVTEPAGETTVPTEAVTEPAGETTVPTESVTEPTAETELPAEPAEETTAPTEVITEPSEETAAEAASDEVMAASVIAEGRWNSGWTYKNPVNWRYDSDGTFTVYGTGKMQGGAPQDVKPYIKSASRIVIQEGITGIGNYAFCYAGWNNPEPLTVEIANTVTEIDYSAFEYCKTLTEVTIPDSVTTFGSSVFRGCTNLTSITLSNNLSNIADWTFYECSGLKSITIPGSVNTIGERAFEGCTSLTDVTIEEGVKRIEKYAFYCTPSTSQLKRVSLPESLNYIDAGAFLYAALTEIIIPGAIDEIREDTFFACHELQKVVLPKNLQKIGKTAFAFNILLESVTIPKNVSSIGNSAFSGCTNLGKVYFTGNAPEFGSNIFGDCKLTAYYPEDNMTWSPDVMQNYGGKVTWVAYTPEDEEDPTLLHNTLASLTEVDYMAFSHIAYRDFSEYTNYSGNTATVTVKDALKQMGKWKSWFNQEQDIRYSDLCKHIGQWKVLADKDFGGIHGFYAVAFTNDAGEVVIAYRGSTSPAKILTSVDGAMDWLVNDLPAQLFNIAFMDQGQYEWGWYFYEMILNKGYNAASIAVTGHSLGGGLAEIVSARYGCKGVSMNAICILDAIYDVAPLEMGRNFYGVDAWNFVDHANYEDICAGMFEYHWPTAMKIKPVIAHETNTTLSVLPDDIADDAPMGEMMGVFLEALGDVFSCHSMNTYVTKDASGNVVLTDRQAEFHLTRPISKMQAITISLDLGTSWNESFHKGLSIAACRTSFGGDGADEIYSSIQSDTLIGGKGNDVLNGGRNGDTYVYYKGDGYDIIHDVSGADTIHLMNFAATDNIDVVSSGDSDFITILCNGAPIMDIYKKNRDYSQFALDSFVVYVENRPGHIDITDLFSKKAYDSHMVIQCPVSIEILDEAGTVVFTLENDAVGAYYTDYGSFFIFEEEDGGYGKTLDLIEGYTARIVGQDDGTMKIEYWDVTDQGLSEAPKTFAQIPVSTRFAATFEATTDGELVLAADTDGDHLVDAKIDYDGNEIPVEAVSLAQELLVLKPEESTRLSADVKPAELAEFVQWTVEAGGEEIIGVDAEGNVTARQPGTAYVLATVTGADASVTARCRVDVAKTKEEKILLNGIRLSTPKLTSELFSRAYAAFDILLMLPQNDPEEQKSRTASWATMAEKGKSVAIESVRFTEEAMAEWFELVAQDDRRILVVPRECAVQNPEAVKSSYTGSVTATIQGEEYTSENLTLTVKKSKPKLKATVPAFNSFYSGQSRQILITGGTPTEIYEDAKGIPGWLTLKDGALTLTADAPLKSTSGKANLLVETQEWRIPAALVLNVKNTYKVPGLKLSAAGVTMTAQAENSMGVKLMLQCKSSKETLKEWNVAGITAPQGYAVEDYNEESGSFVLKAKYGFAAGKITLKVSFRDTGVTLPLTLTVRTAPVKLKLDKSGISLNKTAKESAVVTVTAAPADYRLDLQGYRLTDAKGADKKYTGELAVRLEGDRILVGTTDTTVDNGTYKLYVSAGGSKEAVLTIKTVSADPDVTLKAKGNLDLTFPDQPAVIIPAFKNYNGTFSIAEMTAQTARKEDASGQFRAEENDGTVQIRCAEDTAPGTYTLKLKLELPNGGSCENTVKITVKRTDVKLKLSASKLTLNKALSDKASVTVTCATRGYLLGEPIWQLMDKTGKCPAEGRLDIGYEDGILTAAVNEGTQYGETYKLLIKANENASAQTLTVTVPAENQSQVTVSLKTGGKLDVIRDGSAITVTPGYKNCGAETERVEELLFYSSGDNYTEPLRELFRYEPNGNGGYTVSKIPGAALDHSLKYKAKLVTTFRNGITAESALVSLKITMGSAKLKLDAADSSLFAKDKNDRIAFQITASDPVLNQIQKAEIKDGKMKDLFQVLDYGNGRYALAFRGGLVDSSLISKSASKNVTVTLNVWLEGNRTGKANGTVQLKVSVLK